MKSYRVTGKEFYQIFWQDEKCIQFYSDVISLFLTGNPIFSTVSYPNMKLPICVRHREPTSELIISIWFSADVLSSRWLANVGPRRHALSSDVDNVVSIIFESGVVENVGIS